MTDADAAAAENGAMQPLLVSVVIPAYNAEAYLGECVRSVQSQVGAFELEIIVIDDGSTDGTANVARTQAGVSLRRQPCNRGPSSARNAGIADARGEFVAFIDADDLWPSGKLASQLAVLQRQPSAAMVFGDCRQFDELGPRTRTQFESGRLGSTAWGRGEIVPDAYLRLLDDNFITTGSVVARRSVLKEAGGFAEDLRLVEDLDLWLRISRRHPIAWCDCVCLLRRRHDANLSRDAEAMSLAYLDVLRRQTASNGDADTRLVRHLAMLTALEQVYLADLALGRGLADTGLRWAISSMRVSPSRRALWRVGQAAVMHLVPSALKRAGAKNR